MLIACYSLVLKLCSKISALVWLGLNRPGWYCHIAKQIYYAEHTAVSLIKNDCRTKDDAINDTYTYEVATQHFNPLYMCKKHKLSIMFHFACCDNPYIFDAILLYWCCNANADTHRLIVEIQWPNSLQIQPKKVSHCHRLR